MNKIWFFGDSYAIPFGSDRTPCEWSWTGLLSRKLGFNSCLNASELGISNEYILKKILDYKSEISKNDTVVVISTSIARRWFFYDKPWASNFHRSKNLLGKNELAAVNTYIKFLYNEDQDMLLFHQFLGCIHHLTDTNRWNTIVIPGFEERGYPVSHRYQVRGSLIDICEKEFESKNTLDWYWLNFKGLDQRAGHLCKDNHQILADKIYSTLATGVELDLTVGFREKMISKNNFNHV